jgi:hypothetical protein
MTYSVDEIKDFFFRYLTGELPIEGFEQWIYSTPEIESYFGKPAYFEFISFNFQQPDLSNELFKLIGKHIDLAKFRDWQIKRLLKSLLDGTLDAVEVFKKLYDMYRNGYHFLDKVGIQYLLGIDEIPKLSVRHLWDEKEFIRQRKKLDGYLRPLKDEIEILLEALESGQIVLFNEKEYFIKPELSQKLQKMRQVSEHESSKQSIQASEMASTPTSLEKLYEPLVTPVVTPRPSVRATGEITYNEKWNLTPRIKDLLEQVSRFGVNIYSSLGESNYTFLVPSYLSHEEYNEVERLLREVGKAVQRKVNYVDWYPHGTKFRIDGPKGSAS